MLRSDKLMFPHKKKKKIHHVCANISFTSTYNNNIHVNFILSIFAIENGGQLGSRPLLQPFIRHQCIGRICILHIRRCLFLLTIILEHEKPSSDLIFFPLLEINSCNQPKTGLLCCNLSILV